VISPRRTPSRNRLVNTMMRFYMRQRPDLKDVPRIALQSTGV
jgi:hypothetical protein